MLFKDLRKLIYCPCKCVYGPHTSNWIDTLKEHTKYDDDEVIGIRVRRDYIEVNLKYTQDIF